MKCISICAFLCLFFISVPLFADKTVVEIIAPDTAKKGETVTIQVKVRHHGNNLFHHTDWVYVKANGKEIARWKFSWKSLPENENFSREVQYTVEGAVKIEAEGNCNLHGSYGVEIHTIKLR